MTETLVHDKCWRLDLVHEHLASPDLDEGALPGVGLGGEVVEQHPEDDHGGAEAGQQRDLVTEHQHRAPDQGRALRRNVRF